MKPVTVTDAPDARLPGEDWRSCIMRLWAPHGARAVRSIKREAALKLDRKAATHA